MAKKAKPKLQVLKGGKPEDARKCKACGALLNVAGECPAGHALKMQTSIELLEKLRANLEAVAPLALELRQSSQTSVAQLVAAGISPAEVATLVARRLTITAQVCRVEGFIMGCAEQALRSKQLTEDQHRELGKQVHQVIHGA